LPRGRARSAGASLVFSRDSNLAAKDPLVYKFPRFAVALATIVLSSSLLLAADDATYRALRALQPDGRTIAVNNFSFDRDVYHVTLTGTLHLLAPVDGKTVGAVFRGQGAYQLTPASPVTKRQLQINAGDDKLASLSDTFDQAMFYDTALVTAAEAAGGAAKPGTVSPDATSTYNEYFRHQKNDFHSNMQLRLLETALNNETQPPFIAWVKAKKYAATILAVDPLGVESLHLEQAKLGGEQTALYSFDSQKGGYWYLSRLKREIDSGKAEVRAPLADAEHYVVDTTIAPNADLSGTTTMAFTNAYDGTRVLPLQLRSRIRLKEVAFAAAGDAPQWTAASFIQETYNEDPDAAVVFPAALKSGQKYLLKFTYGGGKDVLISAGDGNYFITSRESWYPNVGSFSDTATFDLTFRIPQKMQIVSVGNETSNTVSGDQRIAVWKSDTPIRVAGFNYGKFKKLSQTDKDSGFVVDVYTNPGTPDVIRTINGALEAASHNAPTYYGEVNDDAYVGPSFVRVDTGSLAQSALADAINTARTGKAFFGALPQNHVSITQQSEPFSGQSWPQLVYLPYIAFLDSMTRNTLGLNDLKEFVDVVGPHEFAHQWWIHAIAPKSYHDAWLSEGFAEFTAGLVLQQTGGWKRYDAFWETKRKVLTTKDRGALLTYEQAGPISQGFLLSNWQTPYGYNRIVYDKGAYVLHMLRMAMQDRKSKNPDEAFTAMMTDFAKTYSGKNVTTEQFQAVAEKYAPQSMRITQDGKLDWFFQQWVYGTTIPRITQNLTVTDEGSGKYRISGTIVQSEVPDNFAVVMPLYAIFDKGAWARLGSVAMVGNKTQDVNIEIPMPRKPSKVVANAMHDILTK
jgi:hypothetical protein